MLIERYACKCDNIVGPIRNITLEERSALIDQDRKEYIAILKDKIFERSSDDPKYVEMIHFSQHKQPYRKLYCDVNDKCYELIQSINESSRIEYIQARLDCKFCKEEGYVQ